ncbi:MAG: PrsW family intramembrane metalloprotease [Caldilineaceae bacterium]
MTAASILEPLFVHQLTPASVFSIAFIEELVKITGVLMIARRLRHDSEIDGIILEAAAGMGFAALESMGYAFTGFLRSGGSLSATVFITMIRGLTAPLGHGTWTAILASVLFREARQNHFHINLKVLGAFVTVVLLHALWDLMPMLAAFFALPGAEFYSSEAIVGSIGLFILWRRWREGRRLQEAEAPIDNDHTPGGIKQTAPILTAVGD